MKRPSLEPLLEALREKRFPVGVDEVLRLREIFVLEPELDEETLRQVLTSVLAKDPQQRAELHRAFDAWIGDVDGLLALEGVAPVDWPGGVPEAGGERIAPPVVEPIVNETGAGGSRWLRWAAPAGAMAVTLVAVAIFLPGLWPFTSDSGGARRDGGVPTTGDPARDAGTSTGAPDPGTRPTWHMAMVPVIEVVAPDRTATRIGFIGGCVSLFLLFFVWSWTSRDERKALAAPEPPPARAGPAFGTLLAVSLGRPALLGPQDEEALVWGIGRFVSDEPTRRLDVGRTVEATARAAGLPKLVFEMERFHRTVSLWVDDGADDPAAARLATEVEAALAAAGLPSERLTFWGVPDRFRRSDGTDVGPDDLEEASASAVVLVLTDGRLLGRLHGDASRGGAVRALLRRLGTWPRLAFVDFSAGGRELQTILRPHEITLLAPREIAGFLGADATRPAQRASLDAPALRGDGLAWAATSALVPHPVDEDTLFALRQALGLKGASPWTMQLFRHGAPGPGGTIEWRHADRCALLRWLVEAEVMPADGAVPEASLLGRALQFWQARYDEEAKERKSQGGDPWTGTTAERRLETLRLLLQLWTEPDVAAPRLHVLGGGVEGEELRRRMEVLAPAESAGAGGVIVLPWRFADRPEEVKVLLAQMGFARAAGLEAPQEVRRVGRKWAALGLCAGLAVGAFGAMGVGLAWPEKGKRITADDLAGSFVMEWTVGPDDEPFPAKFPPTPSAAIGSPGAFTVRALPEEGTLHVSWREDVWPCEGVGAIGGSLNRAMHCAPDGVAPVADTPQYFILLASTEDTGARALADLLLSTGSASSVFLVPGLREVSWLPPLGDVRLAVVGPATAWPLLHVAWSARRAGVPVPPIPQALFVDVGNWGLLSESLRGVGVVPVEEVWPGVDLRGVLRGSFLLRGLGGAAAAGAPKGFPKGAPFPGTADVTAAPGTAASGSAAPGTGEAPQITAGPGTAGSAGPASGSAADAKPPASAADKVGVGVTTSALSVAVAPDPAPKPKAPEPPLEPGDEPHETISFGSGRSAPAATSGDALDWVAAKLLRRPDLLVAIVGHTDTWEVTPKSKDALALSRARARAVKFALKGRGVNIMKVKVVGRGADAPTAKNDTVGGRAKNRRVEFVIIGNDPSMLAPAPKAAE